MSAILSADGLPADAIERRIAEAERRMRAELERATFGDGLPLIIILTDEPAPRPPRAWAGLSRVLDSSETYEPLTPDQLRKVGAL